MSVYRFTIHIAAPPEQVFDLWTDLERFPEWIGGVTKVTDVTGPSDRTGTRYTVHFGRMRSPTEILEAERPRIVRTRFGSWLLRGQTLVTFEPQGTGTLLTQEFRTRGVIPAIAARVFASGSWGGSFRGELKAFAKLAKRDASAAQGGRP